MHDELVHLHDVAMSPEPSFTWPSRVPKVELHLHLEGAIPLPALWQLMEKYGGDPAVPTPQELLERFRYTDFQHFIATWVWKNSFLREYDDFAFIAEAVAQDIRAKGGKAEAMVVDVSKPAELDRLAAVFVGGVGGEIMFAEEGALVGEQEGLAEALAAGDEVARGAVEELADDGALEGEVLEGADVDLVGVGDPALGWFAVVLGGGKKVFDGGEVPTNLTLLDAPEASPNGIVHLRYGMAEGEPQTGDMS